MFKNTYVIKHSAIKNENYPRIMRFKIIKIITIIGMIYPL